MTQITAQAQIKAIQKAQQKATQSKESALKFLKEAGIIQEDKTESKNKSITKKSK
jgi:hypothetical protein